MTGRVPKSPIDDVGSERVKDSTHVRVPANELGK